MNKSNKNLFRDLYDLPYSKNPRVKIFNSCKASADMLQRMVRQSTLPVHNGCVNTICWNSKGDCILSGSDDQRLVVSNVFTNKVLYRHKTNHRNNIFSAKYLPNNCDKDVVSCSGDGLILLTDLNRPGENLHNEFTCHNGTTYKIQTLPGDPHSFLSCGEDGCVRWFDLRQKTSCFKPNCREDVLLKGDGAVTSMSVNMMYPYQLAIACSDGTARVFDRRKITANQGISDPLSMMSAPNLRNNSCRITSVQFSPDGEDLLVSYSSDYLYLFGVKESRTLGFHMATSPPIQKQDAFKPGPRAAPVVKRLRLRGDWSDTGPHARPERDSTRRGEAVAQVRPTLHATLMQRMTDVLARMLNDPATRAALNGASDEQRPHDINVPRIDEEVNEADAPIEEEQPEEPIPNQAVFEQALAGGLGEESEEELPPEPQPMSSGDESSDLEMEPVPETAASASANQASVPSASVAPWLFQPMPSPYLPEPGPSSRPDHEPPHPNPNPVEPRFFSTLQERLHHLREGFIEKHHVEPSVNLTFSKKGSNASTISMRLPSNHVPKPEEAAANQGASHSGHSEEGASASSSHELPEPSYSEGIPQSQWSTEDDAVPVFLSVPLVKQKFVGHRNARTMIKEATFWGDEFVMSGSDCGHVFLWERTTGQLVMLLEADKHVVNCLQPHPYLPLLATSGIDYDVKIWAPRADQQTFDPSDALDLMQRNAIMLEETRDTITVPASFMIRMLACLNQIRRGGRARLRSRQEEEEG